MYQYEYFKDKERLLLFNHMTVYMLGRGAEKNLMIFLSAEDDG